MLTLKVSMLTIYIVIALVLLVLLAGCLVILYIAIGNRLFASIFYRKEPMPTVDRSPLEIEQKDVIGKGRNWFYTNRMEFLNVRVTAYDGVKLAGYYRPSFDRECRNVLILLHGYNEHPSMVSAYAKLIMTKIQCHVLIVHQRAHLMSGGKYTSYGLCESVDLNSWIEFCKKQAGENCRIFIYGRCMGAVTALLAAEQEDFSENVAGIIADSPYDNFERPLLDLGKRKYKINISFLYKWVKRCVTLRFGFDIDQCDCAKKAHRIEVPVLMFHGEKDHIVNPEASKIIYDRIRSPKRMIIVEDADHMESYAKAPALYEKEVQNFIEQCVIRLVKLGKM
ncbi:MAG: alpha/beta hydrolase [Clostridiales bacterium]|nr:alpha/beta hydrolase [Clostridiales bacterium]